MRAVWARPSAASATPWCSSSSCRQPRTSRPWRPGASPWATTWAATPTTPWWRRGRRSRRLAAATASPPWCRCGPSGSSTPRCARARCPSTPARALTARGWWSATRPTPPPPRWRRRSAGSACATWRWCPPSGRPTPRCRYRHPRGWPACPGCWRWTSSPCPPASSTVRGASSGGPASSTPPLRSAAAACRGAASGSASGMPASPSTWTSAIGCTCRSTRTTTPTAPTSPAPSWARGS